MKSYIGNRAENYLAAKDREFYSAEDVADLCRIARVSDNLVPVIADTLKNAARAWLEHATNEAEDRSQTHSDLDRINTAAHELSEAIGGAGQSAWDAMLTASEHPEFAFGKKLGVETPHVLVPGEIVIKLGDREATPASSSMSMTELQDVIQAIQDLSLTGQLEIRKPGRGRPKNRALDAWISQMHELWFALVDQPFTAGRMEG